jgi:hypothetical protein
MKKTLKTALLLLMTAAILASFAVGTFAASASYRKAAKYASQELVDVTCNYKSLKKDTFTVTNNGTVPMLVYINGGYWDTIRPGESYTHTPSHAFKHRVQIYAQCYAPGANQRITVTSTSGVIYNS